MGDAGADPANFEGKPKLMGSTSEQSHQTCRGISDGMQAKGTRRNTGSPSGDRDGSTGSSRETGRAVWGDGEAHSTDEAG
jgi:hypothetical protein